LTIDDPRLGIVDEKALTLAVEALERPGFAASIADYAGQPINRVLKLMPSMATDRLNALVRPAILSCLETAIDSLDPQPAPPMPWLSSTLAGITGGIGGIFGWSSLAVELPITTTLMLRAIADIARHEGEDLTTLQGRLACMEVFALGGNRAENRMNVGYYAARAFLARLTGEATAYIVERGVTHASAPVLTNFVAEIGARYGVVVSDRAAASAIPLLGAIGGATINVIFMEHFQHVAQGHFTVRRLERKYGAREIQARYDAILRRQREVKR